MPDTPRSILHVLQPAAAGGLETVVRLLAAEQHGAGRHVAVAAVVEGDPEAHPFIRSLRSDGTPVIPIVAGARDYSGERRSVAAAGRKHGAEILHTHGYRVDIVDSGVARAMGAARVTTVHGFTGGGWKNRLYERLQVRAHRRFDAVVAVSRPIASILEANGVPPERIHVVRNAFRGREKLLDRAPARESLGLPANGFVVGWVGRLSREKGADVMVEAIAALRDSSMTFVGLGDGPEAPSLRARAAALGVGDRVKWLGRVDSAARTLRAFDVLLQSSRTEGTPMTLLEAMDADVPIVATRVGGVPDIMSELEGWLVSSEDPIGIGAALKEVRDNPEEAAKRTRAARSRLARERDPAVWLTEYDAVYSAAIQGRTKSR